MTTDWIALCAELTDVLDGLFEDPEIPSEIRRSHSLEEYLTRARAALADGPAVPEGREPASVTGQFMPTDAELLCIAAEEIDGYGNGINPGDYEPSTEMAVEAYGSELCAYARAVLTRWGNPAPQPPADGTEEQVWPPSVADGCHEVAISAVTGSPEQQLLATAGNTIDNLWNELEREGWALHRLHRLQQENARFREPERTILCDILANGTLLPDPDGKRYGVRPVDGEVAELVAFLKGCTDERGFPIEFTRAADLLQRLSPPQPVLVSERLPGPKDCDADGMVWVWDWLAKRWCLCTHSAVPPGFGFDYWLSAHALPIPQQQENTDD